AKGITHITTTVATPLHASVGPVPPRRLRHRRGRRIRLGGRGGRPRPAPREARRPPVGRLDDLPRQSDGRAVDTAAPRLSLRPHRAPGPLRGGPLVRSTRGPRGPDLRRSPGLSLGTLRRRRLGVRRRRFRAPRIGRPVLRRVRRRGRVLRLPPRPRPGVARRPRGRRRRGRRTIQGRVPRAVHGIPAGRALARPLGRVVPVDRLGAVGLVRCVVVRLPVAGVGSRLRGPMLSCLPSSMSPEGSDAHFEACLTLSALFLAGSLLAVVVLVEDKGPSYDVVPDEDSDAYVAIPEQSVEQEEKRGTSPSPPSNLDVDKAETDGIAPDQDYMSQSRRGSCIDASALLFTVQAAGWVSICASSFFWTSWRGEEAGCADLALQSVVGIVIAALLPRANAHLGPATVWLGSELSFHLLMISTMLASGSKGRSARAIGALSGVNYAVHATNGLIVATGLVPDPSRRARTIAMVNNALPAGQLVTAVTGGAIAQYFGGFEHSFVSYGFLGAIVTAMAWWISSRRGLFH
ncbi:hypothetical protein ACHAWF_012312, partial [Thalassiosira exigua]